MNILIDTVIFILFVIMQGFFINGWKATLEKDMIFHRVGLFIQKVLGDYWSKPFVGCVKCMASVGGMVTFWPAVIWFKGYHHNEWMLFIFDVFILVPASWLIYKKM